MPEAVQYPKLRSSAAYGAGPVPPADPLAEEGDLEELEESLDSVELSPQGRSMIPPARDEDSERLFRLLRESTWRIQRAAEEFQKFVPETVRTPAVLGLALSDATTRLKGSGLGVSRVSQEYSEQVPKGQIVTQVPAPGAKTTTQLGVTLVVSKGPPPKPGLKERERHPKDGSRELEQESAELSLPMDLSFMDFSDPL